MVMCFLGIDLDIFFFSFISISLVQFWLSFQKFLLSVGSHHRKWKEALRGQLWALVDVSCSRLFLTVSAAVPALALLCKEYLLAVLLFCSLAPMTLLYCFLSLPPAEEMQLSCNCKLGGGLSLPHLFWASWG